MATQAKPFDGYELGAAWGEAAPHRASKGNAGPGLLPPLPQQSLYLFRKAIDNSGVKRQPDPQGRTRQWRWIATTMACTFLLVALLWPNIYGMLAGYQIEALKTEQQRLQAERASLELQEANLLSPEKLEELARNQEFIDPAPNQVVYLPPAADGSLAQVTNSK